MSIGLARHFEHPPENILQDKGAEVADVGGAVNRWPAAVEAESSPVERHDGFRPATQRIVEFEAHCVSRCRFRGCIVFGGRA